MRHKTKTPSPAAFKKNLEIEVQSVAFGGEGIGHVDGKTCFVEGGLPGETVIVQVTQEKRNFLRSRVLKVLDPSPMRLSPPCPYVETCGGCQYQHVSYGEELRLKEDQVRSILSRALGEEAGGAIEKIRHAGREYRTRNSVTLHRTSRDPAREQPLGFVGRDNKSVVSVRDCLLADERLSEVFQTRVRMRAGGDRATFRLGADGRIASDFTETFPRVRLPSPQRAGAVAGVGDRELIVSSQGFFQNNLAVTALAADEIRRWVESLKPAVFFDLFSGVGTFAFLSGTSVPAVVCIEENPASLRALRMNREEHRRPDFEIIEGRVEKAFPIVFSGKRRERAVLCLDPPRGGLDPELARFLSGQSEFLGIAYVSCDPTTLARDLKILTSGPLRLERAVPFDMFPRTKHIETVAFLAPR